MGRSASLRWIVATMATFLVLGTVDDASASSALELVRIARALEQRNDVDLALRRYMDALSLDPSCAEAYLGLGSLRARRGDLREAERVYSTALERIPGLRAARTARAHVRRALGANTDAAEDLLAGADDELEALRVLASWYGHDGQAPAQLSIWRVIFARAEALQRPDVLREARTMIRALVILVDTADPAASPPDEHGFRRTVSVVARRGGA